MPYKYAHRATPEMLLDICFKEMSDEFNRFFSDFAEHKNPSNDRVVLISDMVKHVVVLKALDATREIVSHRSLKMEIEATMHEVNRMRRRLKLKCYTLDLS